MNLDTQVPVVISSEFATGDSVVDDTTTAEVAHANNWSVPADFLVAGRHLRVTIFRELNCGAGPPTMTHRLRLGGLAGTLLYQNVAFTPAASARQVASIVFDLYVVSAGAAGSIIVSCVAPVNNTVQPVTINTTVAADLVFTSQWGSNPANTHTLLVHGMRVEVLA